MKIFTGDFIWKRVFLPFSSKTCKIQQCLMVFYVSKFQKNARICGFLWTFRSKVFKLQGGKPPWPLDQGLCPWTLLGAPPPDPRYRLALHVLAMAPLCQILNTPLPTWTLSFAGDTKHTVDRAHPTQVLNPSTYWSLYSTLMMKKLTLLYRITCSCER